jgi:hypothetical protein
MLKIIKICKISYVIYTVVIVVKFILSIITDIAGSKSGVLAHLEGWRYYIPSFFSGLVTVLFYYLFTIFVEKWCKKNDIE